MRKEHVCLGAIAEAYDQLKFYMDIHLSEGKDVECTLDNLPFTMKNIGKKTITIKFIEDEFTLTLQKKELEKLISPPDFETTPESEEEPDFVIGTPSDEDE